MDYDYYIGLYYGVHGNRDIVFKSSDDIIFYGWVTSEWTEFPKLYERDKSERGFKKITETEAESTIFLEGLG
tara:strand:+ start:182 stop:397 length:216 start_codon:yes stop_codon:yes gene_type:complete